MNPQTEATAYTTGRASANSLKSTVDYFHQVLTSQMRLGKTQNKAKDVWSFIAQIEWLDVYSKFERLLERLWKISVEKMLQL